MLAAGASMATYAGPTGRQQCASSHGPAARGLGCLDRSPALDLGATGDGASARSADRVPSYRVGIVAAWMKLPESIRRGAARVDQLGVLPSAAPGDQIGEPQTGENDAAGLGNRREQKQRA
jgi:hypothetical protein